MTTRHKTTCRDAAGFTKSKLATRLGLTTAFVVSMGFGTATATAADQATAGEKPDRALRDAGKAAEQIARDSAVLAEDFVDNAQDALGEALDAVDRALENMPQFEQPELDDEGNIIIRRKSSEKDGTEI